MSRSLTAQMGALVVVLLVFVACAPAAAPSPTSPPAKPAAPTAAPAKPTEAPAAKPVEKAAEKPAAKPTGAPPAKPAEKPVAKPAFDEKAIADFYRGKTIRIIVGSGAGGGFDAYTRTIARTLPKYIPGQPTIVVEFLPGGSGILAANQIYNNLPKDGTIIGMIVGPIILEQLFKSPGIEFDMGRFQNVSVPVAESYVFFVHKRAGITKFEDILGPNGKEIVVGGIAGSTPDHAPIMMRDLLGAKIKLVSGYDGTAKVRLAIDGGEVDGFFNTWQSAKSTSAEQVKDGTYIPIAQMNDKPMADLPGKVPTILDIAKTDEQRQLLLFGASHPNQFGKLYVVAPDAPADRVAALDEAFAKTMADKEFLADAEKARLEISPLRGEQITKLIKDMLGMSDSLKSRLKQIMQAKPS